MWPLLPLLLRLLLLLLALALPWTAHNRTIGPDFTSWSFFSGIQANRFRPPHISILEKCQAPYFRLAEECLLVVNLPRSWDKARKICQRVGGDLAQPRHIDLLGDYLNHHQMAGSYWLGGTDFESEGQWRWLSGDPVTADGWREFQAIGAWENCLVLNSHRRPHLKDYFCDNHRKFICEIPRVNIPGPEERYIASGSQFTIKCVITPFMQEGNYVFWYHNEVPLLISDQNRGLWDAVRDTQTVTTQKQTGITTVVSELTFDPADIDHSGNYTCVTRGLLPASVTLYILNDPVALNKTASNKMHGLPGPRAL